MAQCQDCNGSTSVLYGIRGDGVCSSCQGSGESALSGLNEAIMGEKIKCYNCNGTGKCPSCGGSGEV